MSRAAVRVPTGPRFRAGLPRDRTIDRPRPRVQAAVGEPRPLFLETLGDALLAKGIEVCSSGVCPDAVVEDIKRSGIEPDVVLLSVAIDREDTRLRFVARVRRALPASRVVLLTGELTPEFAEAALEQEVEGVVLDSSSAGELADALAHVAAGASMFPAGWLSAVHRARGQSLHTRLSGRQMQVLELVAGGMTNQEIATELDLSRNTVKFHMREIYTRLGVSNRVQAAAVLSHSRSGKPARAVGSQR